MIPYLLAVAGGYLIGTSLKQTNTFAEGGIIGGFDISKIENPHISIEEIDRYNDTYSFLFESKNINFEFYVEIDSFSSDEYSIDFTYKVIFGFSINEDGSEINLTEDELKVIAKDSRINVKVEKILREELLKPFKYEYAQGGEIANTILQQLGGSGRLRAMTGAYNFVDTGNGLSFRIKNPKANYIQINLNAKDLYDVEVGRIRGNDYKIVKSENDLYFDQLKPFIEEATGMYLSFAEGGQLKIKAKEVELEDSMGNKFFEGKSIAAADEAMYHIWKRGNWSDVQYEIEFEDGSEVEGSIDLEPKSFHAEHKKNILSWHLQTYWGNVSKTDKPYIQPEMKEFAKNLISKYDLNS
jgi:hypothetical protein